MLFATFLAKSHKPQSIKVYLYGVRSLHLQHGFPDPLTDAIQLRRLLRGIKRVMGCLPDTRLPITPSLLRSFRASLTLSYHDHLVLWAALLVAFFGFLRSRELLDLRWQDVVRGQEGYQISLRASETDPFRQGALVRLGQSGDQSLCAVVALDQLSQRTSHRREGMQVFCLATGHAVTQRRLNVLIKALAGLCHLPTTRYSSHSFRIGAATTAAAVGIPDWCIQGLGRWSSDCYRRYIRLPDQDCKNVAELLARSHL